MNKDLYHFDDAKVIMESKGLGHNLRTNDDKEHYRQFAVDGSSLHVKNRSVNPYVLYSTESDYTSIMHQVKIDNKEYVELVLKNDEEITDVRDLVKNNKECFIFVRNGNKILNPKSEKCIPNIVYVYSNENFEYILDVLYQNPSNRK